MTNILKVGVAAAVIALGAGCTDLKPLQAEVDSLKSQVSKLSGDLDGVKTAADGASRAAAAAQQAATRAELANQVPRIAGRASVLRREQRKVNRMFEKSSRVTKSYANSKAPGGDTRGFGFCGGRLSRGRNAARARARDGIPAWQRAPARCARADTSSRGA